MHPYVIFTDSSADLPREMLQDLGVISIPLSVTVEGEPSRSNDEIDIKAFYAALRAKKGAVTAACGIEQFTTAFEAELQKGNDILYLGFSSGLSGTYNAGAVAAKELAERYPARTILTADTLCASMGEGLLVWHAAKKRAEGQGIHQVHDWVEQNKLHLVHLFTVDDLFFLHRGGRVSKTAAVLGSMLAVKPMLHVDNEGHLINIGKVRGRRASVVDLFERMKPLADPYRGQTVFISHGDCIEDAELLADMIRKEFDPADVVISYVGPVIGAHSGPGTLALFFLGKER